MRGWWFSKENRCLAHGDGRLAQKGVTHHVNGGIKLCSKGLHASENILDALKYAPGNILWKVNLSGKLIISEDKMVANYRTYLTEGVDVSDILMEFARWCALEVIHIWNAPDIVINYPKTGSSAVRVAAYDAAYAAAHAAAHAKQNIKLTEMVNVLMENV